MKNVFILLLLFLPAFLFSQINGKIAAKFKKSTLSVKYTDISEVDSNLVKAVKNYWLFSSKPVFKERVSKNSPKLKLEKTTLFVRHKFDDFRVNSYELGNAFVLNFSQGESSQNIGFNKYSNLSYFDFVEALKRSQFILEEYIKENSWGKVYRKTKDKYGKELADKVLLVDRRLLKEKLDAKTFASLYPYKFEIVDFEEIKKAILNNDETKAYISIVEEKVGVNVQYICNAKTGKIYTHKHSVIQTQKSLARKSTNSYLGIGDLKDLVKNIK